jgi:hypothetical protein
MAANYIAARMGACTSTLGASLAKAAMPQVDRMFAGDPASTEQYCRFIMQGTHRAPTAPPPTNPVLPSRRQSGPMTSPATSSASLSASSGSRCTVPSISLQYHPHPGRRFALQERPTAAPRDAQRYCTLGEMATVSADDDSVHPLWEGDHFLGIASLSASVGTTSTPILFRNGE